MPPDAASASAASAAAAAKRACVVLMSTLAGQRFHARRRELESNRARWPWLCWTLERVSVAATNDRPQASPRSNVFRRRVVAAGAGAYNGEAWGRFAVVVDGSDEAKKRLADAKPWLGGACSRKFVGARFDEWGCAGNATVTVVVGHRCHFGRFGAGPACKFDVAADWFLERATEDWFAFGDDDLFVDDEWLGAALARLDATRPVAFGGRGSSRRRRAGADLRGARRAVAPRSRFARGAD